MALSLGDGKSSSGLETLCVVPSHRALESLLSKTKKKKIPTALTAFPGSSCLSVCPLPVTLYT